METGRAGEGSTSTTKPRSSNFLLSPATFLFSPVTHRDVQKQTSRGQRPDAKNCFIAFLKLLVQLRLKPSCLHSTFDARHGPQASATIVFCFRPRLLIEPDAPTWVLLQTGSGAGAAPSTLKPIHIAGEGAPLRAHDVRARWEVYVLRWLNDL